MAQEKTSKKKTNKVSDAKRHGIQAVWAFLTNSHVSGFVTGKIYTGKLKNVCVPGLNCYSCPGAVGACPIGSLQAVVGSWNFKMAYYVVGFLIFIGAIFGRLICGFLCPFGLIQDLLNKIPFPKKIRTFKGDKLLRKLKYVIFAVFVILLPMFLVDIMGQGSPYFCKLICPAGTLEGGIPLALLNKSMRSALGALYVWKNADFGCNNHSLNYNLQTILQIYLSAWSILFRFQQSIFFQISCQQRKMCWLWKMRKGLSYAGRSCCKRKQPRVHSLWTL